MPDWVTVPPPTYPTQPQQSPLGNPLDLLLKAQSLQRSQYDLNVAQTNQAMQLLGNLPGNATDEQINNAIAAGSRMGISPQILMGLRDTIPRMPQTTDPNYKTIMQQRDSRLNDLRNWGISPYQAGEPYTYTDAAGNTHTIRRSNIFNPGEPAPVPGVTSPAPAPSVAAPAPAPGVGAPTVPPRAAPVARTVAPVPPVAPIAPTEPYRPPELTGMRPGQAEAMGVLAQGGARMGQDLNNVANKIPENRTALDLMRADLQKAGPFMGPTAQWEHSANLIAGRVLGFFPTMTKEQIAGLESFEKLGLMLAGQQAATLNASDAAQRNALGTVPNSHISKLGNEGIIDMIHGNYDYIAMKARELNKAIAAGLPADKINEWSDNFNATHDPRVFQYARMSKEEQDKLVRAVPDGRRLLQNVYDAARAGWIDLDQSGSPATPAPVPRSTAPAPVRTRSTEPARTRAVTPAPPPVAPPLSGSALEDYVRRHPERFPQSGVLR